MSRALQDLVEFVREHDGINNKSALARKVTARFGLTRDRSVFYCADFAVRFSSSSSISFSNTVLSLSNLKKFDDRPFLVCLVTPTTNHLLLANTTFSNNADNLERLFEIHAGLGFEQNLPRLVEATNNISPTGEKFFVGSAATATILHAPGRADRFVHSRDAEALKAELDEKVQRFRNEILLASLIENVNVRGRIIEYLIAGEDEALRAELIRALQDRTRGIPQFKTENALGDYRREFAAFDTETDVKTKIMFLNSNPKAYNIDKMLEFLSHEKSVFLFYFVGVDATKIVNTVLVSMFETQLLACTIVLRHWAGRNSRGVTQLEGHTINSLIALPSTEIDPGSSEAFLKRLIAL